MSSRNEFSRDILERFANAWESPKRPWIADFLSMAELEDRDALLAKLIPIDISFRVKRGEKPRPGDYLQLGGNAVAIAFQEMHESFESIHPEKDYEATFDDSQKSVNGDKAAQQNESRPNHDDKSMTTGFTGNSDTFSNSRNESASDFIGRYKLLEQIGEGGMGAVWMAEQSEPVQRRVALKLIRADRGSKDTIARFDAERQAIAMMDHQNIAKIFDAGTTDSGTPFFVMELVNGIPLNKYCDQKKLNIRERLELMIPVCRAIQHAHQKGIIHRDLKHSNVLVTQYDGKPVPKVIDFGLAKAFEQEHKLTDKTMFTEFGKVVGTLQYMSPEQAEMNNVDVDTRSDIYSIGVMTYKLLVGSTPLVNETITSHSFMQLLEFIREGETPTPSERLKSLDKIKLEKIAINRNAKPDKLLAQVSGDLDWIVMKALEKERNRRYETANGMARDMERFLANEEVSACPPTTMYRLQKFYKRNQGLVLSTIALSVALLLGTIGTSIGLYWALTERDRANDESIINIQLAKNEKRSASEARKAKDAAVKARAIAEIQLHAIKIKTSWAEWQLGNVETAWKMLNELRVEEFGWESQFLRTEFAGSQKTLYGHALFVMSLDASPDGKLIATACNDNTVRIWDANTGETMQVCEIQDAPGQVRFSPDSLSLACVDRSNQVTIWDAKTGKVINTLGPFAEDLTCIAFDESGTQIVVGSDGQDTKGLRATPVETDSASPHTPVVRLLAIADGSVLAKLVGHKEKITGVAVYRNGEGIISCSLDETIRFWEKDGDDYVAAKTLIGHSPGVLNIAISPTDEQFASCGKDSQIRIWDLNSGEFIRSFVGHTDEVSSVRFSTDGTQLVSASTDKTARIWNLNGKTVRGTRVCKGHLDQVTEACFSTDGSRIFTTSFDHTVRFWDARNNPTTLVTNPHTDIIWGADFSQDDTRLVSVSQAGDVVITDVSTGNTIKKLTNDNAEYLTIKHSPVSNVFVTGDDQGKLRVFSSQDGIEMKTIDAHAGYIWDACYTTDGKILATCGTDKCICIWDTEDWSQLRKIVGHDQSIACVRFSKDGKYMVTAGDDHSVKLWDARKFTLIHRFEGHHTSVWRAIFSSNNDLIVSSSAGGEIIVWDVKTRKQLHAIDAHQNETAGLTLTHDDARIISSSDDKNIKVWDMKTGFELFVLRDPGDSEITHVSFSRDGRKLVSGNRGWLTIRSATNLDSNYKLLLPQDAQKLCTDGMVAVTSKQATIKDFERELEIAQRVSQHHPSYESFTILGITQYRLGQYSDAIESMRAAQRLEPIKFGLPGLIPYIEGFLTMSLLKNGQVQLARQVQEILNQKAAHPLLVDNIFTKDLVNEVNKVFEDLAPAEN